jgi:hypothetical protein
MVVRRRIFFAALAMTIVAFAQRPVWAQTANVTAAQDPICTVQKDEIEVFVDFLKLNVLPHGPIVLVTSTEATFGNIDHFSDILHATKKYTIPNELREEYKARNESSCTIGAFGGIKNLRFIAEAELAGQREIQKRYGKNAVLIRFSRVGFNSDETLAFLHVSVGVDNIAGNGTLYLLKRNGGAWVIALTVETKNVPGTAHP